MKFLVEAEARQSPTALSKRPAERIFASNALDMCKEQGRETGQQGMSVLKGDRRLCPRARLKLDKYFVVNV